MSKSDKSYNYYLEKAAEMQAKAEEAQEKLALRIGKDVLKLNPEIESFKDYERTVKAIYQQTVEGAQKLNEELQAVQEAPKENPAYGAGVPYSNSNSQNQNGYED